MSKQSILLLINAICHLAFWSSCGTAQNKAQEFRSSECLEEEIKAFLDKGENFLSNTQYFPNYNCGTLPPFPSHDSFVHAQKLEIEKSQKKGFRTVVINCEWPNFASNPFLVESETQHYRICDSIDAINSILGACMQKYNFFLRDSLNYNPNDDYNVSVSEEQKEKSKIFENLSLHYANKIRNDMSKIGDWTKLHHH